MKCLIRSTFDFTYLWREQSCVTINGAFHYPTAETSIGQPTDLFGSTINSGESLTHSLIYLLTHSLIYLLTHLTTYSLTYSLT